MTLDAYQRTRNSWRAMIKRCSSKKNLSFHLYGGKGRKVCKRWLKFENFLKDMGFRPMNMTLDRINNDKGYSKNNCRWATNNIQQNNRSTNVHLFYKGKKYTLAEFARKFKIKTYYVGSLFHLKKTPQEIITISRQRQKLKFRNKPYISTCNMCKRKFKPARAGMKFCGHFKKKIGCAFIYSSNKAREYNKRKWQEHLASRTKSLDNITKAE